MGLLHATHLPSVLNLAKQVILLLAAFGLVIVEFTVALLQVVTHHFDEGDDFGIWRAVDVFAGEHGPILL